LVPGQYQITEYDINSKEDDNGDENAPTNPGLIAALGKAQFGQPNRDGDTDDCMIDDQIDAPYPVDL